MKNASSFPARLFLWFFSRQVFFSALFFFLLYTILLMWVQSLGYSAEVLAACRNVITLSAALGFIFTSFISLYMARRLLVPLGRLIDKTRGLRDFRFDHDENAPEQLTYDEPGEWFELERALNGLGRALRQKTIRLSREKTELRAIMSSISEAVLAISKEKKVLFYNPQFAYLFNLQAPNPSAQLSEILRSPDVFEAYNEALEKGVIARRDVQMLLGSPRHFQLSVAPLMKKHNQEIYGAVGILHDITELKQAERIRIEFVGNVSHELRTPLTTINGYLQTLVGDVAEGRLDQAQEFLRIVTQNVTRLKSLVEDLLDLSALESGKELSIGDVNVREVTENVLKQVDVQNHRVQIRYDVEHMQADASRLEQVLRNLMENAVRYVPKGKNIEIRWRLTELHSVELSVKDDGPGIAIEHQSRLFERFYRVSESRSRAEGGTGIGLSLVKHILQRHGGHVAVRSALGHGSEFICDFPDQPV